MSEQQAAELRVEVVDGEVRVDDPDERRITQWGVSSEPMECNVTECRECHESEVGGTVKHKEGCGKSEVVSRRVATTQFGPCDFGTWCRRMAGLLRTRGKQCVVKTADDGKVALFEV